jgi:hypothetical protein
VRAERSGVAAAARAALAALTMRRLAGTCKQMEDLQTRLQNAQTL